ncbi:GAF and ANTAR domain-containing protein [Williamsia sterculiae]|uniref:GAF domain-containing protein n=1 Tax=Williamsia sterculiae TaxID=1344003 RepID=A0A1N7FXH2_9NOCA|nr:GAF and ANTAR domain-containing protein [Williamsia sterculiae]SIS04936.1 GAF domain-containing protein [Williamsia sterculiae]
MISDSSAEVPDIHREIAQLARDAHGTTNDTTDPADVLRAITASAVALLPGTNHAAVTLVRKRRPHQRAELESTAPTDPVSEEFDSLQHEFGDGPCFTAIWTHHTIVIDDVTTETRWPEFARAVADNTSIRSCMSIQLYTSDLELGALNLHSDAPHAYSDDDTQSLAIVLATHAAIAINTARRGEQFRSALASRDIIGQAKGMIMERYNTNAIAAFNILTKLSQDSNIPLTAVATRLVEADHPTP